MMKSLGMLKQVDHSRKAAIYAAGHDGKLRNFAYTEELGECRETFSRLLHGVQDGEIGVILTPDAASLGIETSPAASGDRITPISDRKSTRLNSSHANISYAVFCLKKKS